MVRAQNRRHQLQILRHDLLHQLSGIELHLIVMA